MMTNFEKVKCRGQYNAELLVILHGLLKKYPELRFGQVLYNFGFITRPDHDIVFRLFDPFNEEPVDMYNRVINRLETLGIDHEVFKTVASSLK